MNDLIVDPHPLSTQGRVVVRAAAVYPRESLGDFLERNGVAVADGRWLVSIGGALVPAEMWACTRPKAGQLILCRRVPGKSALRVVAMIALVAFTFGAAAPFTLAGLTGLTGLGLMAAQAGVYMLGSVLINKLLPPPRARLGSYDQQSGSTHSLQGGRNRARPYEPLGLLLGITKVVPDFNAQPFSWFASDEQYQAVRLHAGINCGSVGVVKIGDTPIDWFSDVVESRVGFATGNTVLPFWSDVDTLAGAVLDAPGASGAWVTRISSAGAVMLVVDVAAQLYLMDDRGRMQPAWLVLELERRLLPGGAWVPLLDAGASVTLTSKSTKAVRRSFSSARLPAGQYEVRARKVTPNAASTTSGNQVEWLSLKTYQEDPSQGLAHQNPQVAFSIKASGQLNGVLDQVSWVATQRDVPVWDGASWVNQATRNPGAHILLLARGIFDSGGRLLAGLGWPDSQIDIEGLKGFMLHCAANGYVFDHWFDTSLSCIEMLEAIAAAGLGSISFHPGRLSVVWLANSQPIEAVVTMGNIKEGTFRVDHTTTTTADELEVSWFDRDNGWANRSLRLKAPGVTTPRDTARLAPLGVTTEAGAVRMARLTMAQNIYQRKSVSWEMDLEHMAFQRYSLIALSHDLTQWGYSGRVQAASLGGGSIVTLTLDDKVPWNAGAAARKIGLRIPGETGYRIFSVATFAGESNVVTLVGAWPGGVPLPGNSAANPAHDTLWIYDFAATPGKRLRVTEIEPSPDLSGAKITAVPEPDEFWTYMASGAYTAPPPPAPAPPLVASNIAVTQRRLSVNVGEGTELSISFDVAGAMHSAQVWGAPSGEALQLLGSTLVPRFGPWTVTRDGGSYAIEVRPFDALGRPGTKATASHAVALGEVLVGGVAADTVATAVANFNASNDRNAAAIAAPTIVTNGNAVDHVVQGNGSVDISFEWAWGGSEGDIDGFIVYVRQSASAAAYTMGTTPAEETAYVVPASKRAFVLFGVLPTAYFTFGVRAYRGVDKDIAAAGLIQSAIAQPSIGGEHPYRPASSIAFAGDVTGTINGVSQVNVWGAISGAGKPENGATVGATWGGNIGGQPGDASLLNSYVPTGINLIYNSAFEAGMDGWVYDETHLIAPDNVGVNNYSPNWRLLPADAPWSSVHTSHQTGRHANGAAYYAMRSTKRIPVTAGKRYILSGYTQAHRCNVILMLRGCSAAGALVHDGAGWAQNDMEVEDVGFGNALTSYKRQWGVYEPAAGSGVAYVEVSVRKGNTKAPHTDSFLFVTRLQLEEVAANVSEPSAWSDGARQHTITAGNAPTYVGGGAIGTPQLGAGAITQVVTATTAAVSPPDSNNSTSKSTTVTLGSITTSANGDGKVLLLLNGSPYSQAYSYIGYAWLNGGVGWNYLRCRLYRNGVLVAQRQFDYTGVYTRELYDTTTMVLDTPGAGVTATYVYEIYTQSDNSAAHRAGIPAINVAIMEIRK